MDTGRTSRHQDSEEQQGYPPQTVIVINIFSLNYVMCIEGGKTRGEKETQKEMREKDTN